MWYNIFTMTEQPPSTTPSSPVPLPAGAPAADSPTPEELRQRRQAQTGLIVGVVVVVVLLIGGLVALFVAPPETTAKVRDIFIIIMAFESLLIGFVLVVLIVQVAKLTNLLQHEIKPILDSTNETVSTLRGTTQFLSDNLVEPVIKLNEYSAALKQLLSLLGLARK